MLKMHHKKSILAMMVLLISAVAPVYAQVPLNEQHVADKISKEQSIKIESLSLKQAQVMAQAAEKKANEINVPMVISVVDASGNLILHERMEDALLVSIDLATKKAYTAVALKMTTEQLGKATQPGQELYGLQHSDDKMAIFGGGIPVIYNGKVIGAIGVSGGSVEQDMAVAQAGVTALE